MADRGGRGDPRTFYETPTHYTTPPHYTTLPHLIRSPTHYTTPPHIIQRGGLCGAGVGGSSLKANGGVGAVSWRGGLCRATCQPADSAIVRDCVRV